MKIVHLIQGTPEWLAHRAQYLNASDAAAMLGVSPYKTRAQLIRELATGAREEVDEATQRRFNDGHRYEQLARPIAEQIIGEELYPCVGTSGKYGASFDGLTLLGTTGFEHKSLNDALRAAMFAECIGTDLPELYQVQMEHQLLVSEESERMLFMASKWSPEGELIEERHCWYMPNAELRARIVAGWEQLLADVAAYEPVAVAEPVAAGRAPEQLPALRIEVTGMVTASNLAEWKEQAIAVFQGISTELVSDQDFADADKTVKWCGDIEDQLKAAKQHALSQTESIDLLFRTIDAIADEARTKRLALEKRVKTRKDERRTEIGNNARRAVQEHILAINETLGQHALGMPSTLIAEIGDAMKGKRSLASMQEAVDVVAANAKVAASQAAERIRANAAILDAHSEHATLFADRVQLCASKTPEDLRNLVAARIAEHQQAEQRRLQEQREQIRKEEEARARKLAEDEARAKAQAEEAAKAPAAPASEPASSVQPAAAVSRPASLLSSPPVPQSTAPAAAPRDVVKIKLGDINAAISPLSITADGLAQLGFKHVAQDRNAKLYDSSQLQAIFFAMRTVLVTAEKNGPFAALEQAA